MPDPKTPPQNDDTLLYLGLGAVAAAALGGAWWANSQGGLRANAMRRYAKPPAPVDPITETDAFKAWFRDSVVVDDYGKPKIVYHGAPDGRGIYLDGFKPSIRGSVYFATDSHSMASSYADARRAWDYQKAEPGVIPLYLYIRNPMYLYWGGKNWIGTELAINKAKMSGHDGVVIFDVVDYYINDPARPSPPATVYVWFEPQQAKSAATGPVRQTGVGAMSGQFIQHSGPNRGTFSYGKPSILDALHTDTRLKDVADVRTNFPDADFWIVRRGSSNKVGMPVKEFNPEHIGIKVLRSDVLDARYLYWVMTFLHQRGLWAKQAHGTTALVNIRTSDVADIPLDLQ